MALPIAHIATALGPSVVNRNSLHILVWSGEAVFAFFVISGLYMSLIVNEKYARIRGGTWRFYFNRALGLCGRIQYHVLWRRGVADHEPVELALRRRVGLVALDRVLFLSAGAVLRRPAPSNAPLLFAAALALRLGMYFAGVPLLPWRYFFFPSDLIFFLAGCLAWRVYRWVRDHRHATWFGAAAATVLASCVVVPPLWTAPDLDQPVAWPFYVLVALCTPALFALTRRWRFDNVLGQLSYPVYLLHILVIDTVARLPPSRALDRGRVATIGTLVLSALLYFAIDRPVERLRTRVGAA